MTSTSFNVGLRDGQRLSSRVLRPPGGAHTNIFGETELQPKMQNDPIPETDNSLAPPEENQIQETNGASQPEVQQEKLEPEAPQPEEVKTEEHVAQQAAPAPEPPRRTRVPPGGFSSGLCTNSASRPQSSHDMQGGRDQSRLLSRLLGKLRGDHHKLSTLQKRTSNHSTMSESTSTGCGSTTNDEEDILDRSPTKSQRQPEPRATTAQPPKAASEAQMDEYQLPSNIDLRYGGQYLTPEQLPEFCDQLHNLVEVIRNIQSYAKVTGEYPRELERRLEHEAREVAALAAEARNACDVVARTRAQRRAVRTQKKHLVSHLATLRETEVRELESTVRLSDRKLFKNWESLKDSTDPAVFSPLLDEVKNKQSALECLVRLIETRKSALTRTGPAPTPLPPPLPRDTNDESATGGRARQESMRCANKRRRKEAAREPRSVPLSGENSRHEPPAQPQVSLYIQGNECSSRFRFSNASAGAVALAPLEFSSHGSVRDILFFTSH